MDPITCLGIATAMVQFVDFGAKLLSEAQEIYHSAYEVSTENMELESVTADLSRLSANLSLPAQNQQLSDDEIELRKVAGSCKEVADELLRALNDIKVEGRHRKWRSLRQALKSVMKKEKIQSISMRLDRLQRQVQFRLISILSQRQSQIVSSVNHLTQESTRLRTRTTGKLDELSDELSNAITLLSQTKDVTTSALHEISAQLMKRISDIEDEKRRVETSLRLLNSLYFKSMGVRLSNVKEQHAKTFGWIFERSQSEGYRTPTFLQWLEAMDGIYWVSGKAGSGKSTLMKYLWYHRCTQDALQDWAGEDRLLTAAHFFWNAGNNSMQTSQIGLLRSLLYQVLRQCPELIIDVCTTTGQCDDKLLPDWTISRLVEAFERLVAQSILLAEQNTLSIEGTTLSIDEEPIKPIKICLFIDGLDEYDGNHAEIVRLFKSSTFSKNVKICLSSRPWNVFENSFGADSTRKLMLQDLTRNDIRVYVYDKLGEDSRFRTLAGEDGRCADLIQQIVDKAEGVFLWVYLIVQSLLNGLEDGNDIPDLQRRVDLLPSDLEKCFKHILSEVDEFYRPQTAQILQMCLYAKSPLPVSTVAFLKAEREDPNYAIVAESKSQTWERLQVNRIEMKTYLNARTKGLLETNVDAEKSFSFQYKVGFLHRTVKDFLQSKEIQDMVQLQLTPGSDINTSLCRASLAQIKCLQPEEISAAGSTSKVLSGQMRELMSYAKEVEIHHAKSEHAILDELDRFLALHTTGARPISRTMIELEDWEEVLEDSLGEKFLAWAIEAGLYLYVEQKLDAHPSLLQPLLTHTSRFGLCGGYMDQYPRKLSRFLNGQSAAQRNETTWSLFMASCCRRGIDLIALLEASAKLAKSKAFQD